MIVHTYMIVCFSSKSFAVLIQIVLSIVFLVFTALAIQE